MSKIQPIANGWNPEAALRDALDGLKDYPDAELLIITRATKDHSANFRASGVTNAEAVFLAEEFKHDVTNRCHDCKCQERDK